MPNLPAQSFGLFPKKSNHHNGMWTVRLSPELVVILHYLNVDMGSSLN